jgi:lysophospholipase L1-like esterase
MCTTDYHCLRPGYQQFALDHLKSFRLLRTLAFALRYPQLDKTRGTSLVRSYAGPLNPAEETTLRVMRAFAEEVRRNAGVPVIVVFPDTITMEEYTNGEMPGYRSLIAQLHDEGIHVLDLTDAFVSAMREGDREFEAFISPLGGHYNEAGNRVVSQAVLDYLVQAGILAP